MKSILRAKDLTKKFGGLVAVDNAAFDVDEREMLGIVGPNGAGKTTIFNLLTGFLRPDSGSIMFGDVDITRIQPYKISLMGISRTFQQVRFFNDVTVFDTVAAPLLLRKTYSRDRVEGCLEAVGLKGMGELMSSKLTYAQQKGLEIARAVVSEPRLLLLDEPYGGLTHGETETIAGIVRRLREEGQTTIVIEHRLAELLQLVERLIVVDFGKIIADGAPEEVLKSRAVIEAYIGKEELPSAT